MSNAKSKRKMQTKMMMQMLENDGENYVRTNKPKSKRRTQTEMLEDGFDRLLNIGSVYSNKPIENKFMKIGSIYSNKQPKNSIFDIGSNLYQDKPITNKFMNVVSI